MRLIILTLAALAMPAAAGTFEARCEAHFSPAGGGEAAIVSLIESAESEIRMLAYSFTSTPIAEALIQAHRRGVDVRAVLDRGQPNARGSMYARLVKSGISTWIDHRHSIQHNKVLVVDGKTIQTGSFNYTMSAQHRNAENVLICESPDGAAAYLADFERHRLHAKK